MLTIISNLILMFYAMCGTSMTYFMSWTKPGTFRDEHSKSHMDRRSPPSSNQSNTTEHITRNELNYIKTSKYKHNLYYRVLVSMQIPTPILILLATSLIPTVVLKASNQIQRVYSQDMPLTLAKQSLSKV